jgi:uncharacterized damage-inducible protein DinB
MFRQVNDFIRAYESLTADTIRIFSQLTDENLNQSVAPGFRSIGHIAWHIVTTIPEMMNRTGLGVSSVDHQSPPPNSAQEIIAGYENASSELKETIKTRWNDDSMLQTDNLYGERWEKGTTLTALINHEIHHRGQMSVLLRQAGQKVPGVFGPSKEEWAAYGMSAPEY